MTGKSGALYKFIKIVPRDDDGNIMSHSDGTNGSYWMLADNYCALAGIPSSCVQANGSASTSAQVWNPTADGNSVYNNWTTMMPIANGVYQRVLLPMYNDLPDSIGGQAKASAILTKAYPMWGISAADGTAPVPKGTCRLTAGSTSMSWGTATANLGNCTYTDKISLPSYTDWQDGLYGYAYFSGPGSTAYEYSMAIIGLPWNSEAQLVGINWGTWFRSPRSGSATNGLARRSGGYATSATNSATTSTRGLSPVIWLSSSLYLNATLSSPGTYDFPHCLAGDNACSSYPSGELLNKIRNGEELLTYESFGAVGDGTTDDGAAIRSAHHFANLECRTKQNCLTVYGTATSTYYIGILNETISIQTSVDWRGATIILDDYIDDGTGKNAVPRTISIFTVESVYDSFNLGVPQDSSIIIKQNTTNSINLINYLKAITPADLSAAGRGTVTQAEIDMKRRGLLQSEEMMALIEDNNTRRFIRSGSDQNSGDPQQDHFLINTQTGDLLNDILWDYNQITRIILYPVDDIVLTLKNVNVISYTDANHQGSYISRNLRIERSNVTIENVAHILDEAVHEANRPVNPQGNSYNGFVRAANVAYLNVKNSKFQPHLYGSYSSYDIVFRATLYTTLDNVTYPCPSGDDEACYADYMLPEQQVRWGIMASHYNKDMVIKNSKLNRIDAHEGVHNLTVTDTIVGGSGMSLIGSGLFYAENVTVDNHTSFVALRADYGSTWNGTMHFKNVTFKPRGPSTGDRRIVWHGNNGNWNYGYDCFYPNIIIDGMTIDDSRRPTALQMSLIPLETTPAQTYPYNFKDFIIFKDVSVKSGKLPNVFPNTQNILQSLYGNTTKTYVYLYNTPVSEGSDFSAYNTPTSQFIVSQDVFPTAAFSPNGNSAAAGSHSTAVTIQTTGAPLNMNSFKYVWTQSNVTEPATSSFTNTFTNGQTITKTSGTGSWYLWVYIEDIASNSIKLVSAAFVFSESAPSTPPTNSSTGTKGIGFTANVESTIAITTNAINDELLLDITPNPTGTLITNGVIVNVSTNNSTGYKLQMNSLTNNTDLVNVLDPNQPNTSTNPLSPLVPTLPTIVSTTAPFGSPATLSSNTWGYSSTTPLPVPPTFIRIPALSSADTLKETTGPDASSTTTVTFGANVNNTIPAGTYTGTIVFTATTNTVPQRPIITSISPTTNWTGGDIYLTGTNFPTVTTGTTVTVGGTACASIRLISDISAICVLPNKPTGSVYSVVITSAALGQGNTNRTVTYDNTNKGLMQEFDTNTCVSMPLGKAEIWTDARNNAIYRIKKMLDNKCWMIDNLAYAGDPPNEDNTYGDVQALTFSTACGRDTWDNSTVTACTDPSTWPGNSNTRRVTTNNFTGSNLPDRMGNTIQDAEGNLYDDGDNDTQCISGSTGSGVMRSECLSYLYNWCAAIGLDSGTNPTCAEVREDSTADDSNGSTAGVTTNTGMADTGIVGKPGGKGGESKGNSNAANQAGVATTNGSICPAGWRLPVSRVGGVDNNKNEFAILNGAMYTVGTNLDPDLATGSSRAVNWYSTGSWSSISSGSFYYTNGLRDQSSRGHYWTSSPSSVSNAERVYGYSGYFVTSYSTGKNHGNSVRCVL